MSSDGDEPLLSDSLHFICYKRAVKLTSENVHIQLLVVFYNISKWHLFPSEIQSSLLIKSKTGGTWKIVSMSMFDMLTFQNKIFG
jgi:hypothetical protein